MSLKEATVAAEVKEKAAHEAMLKQRGITEQEWQTEKEAQRRQTSSNFVNNICGFREAIPFKSGDIFNLPTEFLAVDLVETSNSYIYLLEYERDVGKAFYVQTNKKLSLIFSSGYRVWENLKLEYIGPAEYRQGRVVSVDTWVFSKDKLILVL